MVQVIIKALDILELVAQRSGQAVTLTEISHELQLNQATASNIINTMITKGYLEHVGKKKGYRLGLAAYRLTNEVNYEQDLVSAARETMSQLTAQLNESCLLGVLRNQKRYILHAVHSTQDIQVQIRSERNVYETASGRLLLAYLPEKELERLILRNGLPDPELWEGAATKMSLLEALINIRREGICTTHLKNTQVRGFAVPIFANAVVAAGLSVFLPEYRCSAARQKEIILALRDAAMQISQKLG
ncbi:IclR family transcriptional regulator [Dyadobacter arcticus]|uniref:DNA-binding IclR family transcriptional regulator n=1 Tax=Dyadobacter arcticus TaxID=1078754 RepID=A0ABX0UNS6_9BACT|nr:IclR family transcriptional regulator [Dyadobacter arcticus]NIJ54634.1 DNA-binding IclR family transcriptional regulator [Dyadobacter arcticus]